MRFTKPLLFITLSLLVFVNVQAQVGEKFYGRASYYADKFHGRATSSGETYDRAEYTAAHRELPFNTIVEVLNTSNHRTAVVKINDRGPFAYNRMIDLSFAAAKDLELLGSGEAEVEMRVIAMDNPEYTISTFYAGTKDEFRREFRQYEPIVIDKKNTSKVPIDTSFASTITDVKSLQLKPVTEAFVIADSLKRKKAEGDKMGFRQHKYIRVIKDGDGRYRLDSSIVTSPTPQEVYSVAPQTSKNPTFEPRPTRAKTEIKALEATNNDTQSVMKSVEVEETQSNTQISGFRQHQYVRVYTDSEGRIRLDTTQKAPVQLAKNTTNQSNKTEEKPKTVSPTAPTTSQAVSNSNKTEATKPKEIYQNGFRQHAYIKVYRDKDGKTKLDTTSYEKPK
ncbi:septal ring lytic transglycosylase RlpA family protein [Arcicella sp. LKC2W]|uniref:septal ring lytic transglycosylase RlpA family protein n=1 Tax=Arcicella sp. LKC2W TaxID=2984198 RepID=UPI002B206932|nr:septal ring lytic transglycosylase RlpA family protein [Arcicella sp. LKC2W]MEA5458946.1 septal ring lytic transglycosylase RlpA family protein [Arcicella sp. LKC2W]